ncbi:MAG: hypothetical protein N3A66_04035 [Planctomycetota bacterium]|nr:hypothetical protein [Planctomycetota bacterium]
MRNVANAIVWLFGLAAREEVVMRLTKIALFLPWLFVSLSQGGEEQPRKPPVRVAVLALKSAADVPWLGLAVSESLAVKLAGIDGVILLEREKIQMVLRAAQGREITPALLGVEYLLTGTIQLGGPWEKESKIRINAKVIAAETAKVQGDAAFVEDGTVADLFELESRLAEKFAAALGKEAPALQIDYREEKNLLAKKLFGEGLLKLQEAEALLAQIEDEKKSSAKPQPEHAPPADKDNAAQAEKAKEAAVTNAATGEAK